MPFQLGKKCSAREGIALMVFLCPVLIGLPDLGRTAPGMRVQFTAGGEKCLERIMIGRKTLARFLRGEDCLLLPVRRAAVVGVFFCLAGTRRSILTGSSCFS